MVGPATNPRLPGSDIRRTEILEQLEFPLARIRPARRYPPVDPVEYKVIALRDCPLPDLLKECDCPQKAADYWRLHVATAANFNPEVETFVVLHLNTRRRVRGHHVVASGILDSVQVHSREVFRAAIVAASAAILCLHNHPSGDASPSSADLFITRELVRAGRLLRIEVVDHVIAGAGGHSSLKELGHICG